MYWCVNRALDGARATPVHVATLRVGLRACESLEALVRCIHMTDNLVLQQRALTSTQLLRAQPRRHGEAFGG